MLLLTVALVAFIGFFALFPDKVRAIKDGSGTVVGWLVAIGAAGWVIGALLQLARYGTITTPCCG
jgi:hypothetical protein